MALGLHRRTARSRSGAAMMAVNTLHLRRRIHTICRHRRAPRPRRQHAANGRRVRAPAANSSSHDLNRVPGFHCQPPEGAFYAWVDITGTGITAEEICRILLEDAGVAAIPGAAFGPSGKDFIRFSFASSMANLKEAVERIDKVSAAWQGTLVDDEPSTCKHHQQTCNCLFEAYPCD